MKIDTLRLFFALSAVACSPIADAHGKNPDSWEFELKPLYIWLVTLDGSTTIQPNSPTTNGTSQLDESELTGAFSLYFEASRAKWSIFADYLYSEYTAESANISPVQILSKNRLTLNIAELGGSYSILDKDHFKLDLLGGMRYLNVQDELSFVNTNQASLSANANVWDGFGGLRLAANILDNLDATLRADVGAGTSDLVWNLIATVEWRYLNWGSIYAGYRVLDYQFRESNLRLKLQGKGPVFGLGFYW